MTITGGKGTRAISKRYPVTQGIIAETTRDWENEMNLVPEDGSVYPKRKKEGL